LNCPYCQTNIKESADKIVCPDCHTPHHKECWEENKGCTTYGCLSNPQTQAKQVDVGNETVENIERMLEQERRTPDLTECPGCKKQIEKSSLYCKYCGADINANEDGKKKFEEEFRKRYKDSVSVKRKRFIITVTSISILCVLIITSAYFGLAKLNEYYNSEEYRIKSFLGEWESSWENKDLEKYKNLLDKDYIYYDKDGKAIKADDKIKRMQWTFENYKKISLKISDVKIKTDSTSPNYINVVFKQVYTSDKKSETGSKTLRLYKGEDTGNKWRIFREYFE
jgi:ketosteroid isomerase-like protein